MEKTLRELAMGAALLLSCVACTAAQGGESSGSDTSAADDFTSLAKLPSVGLSGDSLSSIQSVQSASGEGPKPLGEVRQGEHQVVAYTQGKACGLAVSDGEPSGKGLIQLTSEWPEASSAGSRPYAAGPYSIASSSGADGSAFVVLNCGDKAMVVEYSALDKKQATGRGNVSIESSRKTPGDLLLIFGSKDARKEISARLAQSSSSAPGRERTGPGYGHGRG
ncbi:hypothetical protein ACFU99_03770 [Streptomyces sp. NPDC057654]|uniref:hypothetical protein n=1 Tax=Streptomyces sp. NPDC057654 TaxID=3346196 RepID=UPI0036A34611